MKDARMQYYELSFIYQVDFLDERNQCQ